MTHGCPIAAGDRHDLPGLIDERVPGIAAVVHNIVERFEHSVRQPILAHELPDVFLAVEFGCARRQRHQGDVARDLERLGAMPSGLIEQDDCVRAGRNLGCDLIKMKLHGLAVAGWQHEGSPGPRSGQTAPNR